MTPVSNPAWETALGHAPEQLPLDLRESLEGCWVALELYDTHRLPIRTIEAVGESALACLEHLESRGKDSAIFEFVRLTSTYADHR
jgi:hypothetical protein